MIASGFFANVSTSDAQSVSVLQSRINRRRDGELRCNAIVFARATDSGHGLRQGRGSERTSHDCGGTRSGWFCRDVGLLPSGSDRYPGPMQTEATRCAKQAAELFIAWVRWLPPLGLRQRGFRHGPIRETNATPAETSPELCWRGFSMSWVGLLGAGSFETPMTSCSAFATRRRPPPSQRPRCTTPSGPIKILI